MLKIAVIGAGVSGLSVASLLAKAGYNITVFEKSDAISEIGAGVQISPNGFCVLKEMGVSERALKKSICNNSIAICDYQKGKRLLQFEQRSALGNKNFRLMHRADLIDILLEAAESNKVSIKLGCSADASLLSDQYSIVIAADGVHSKTRNFLNPSQRKNNDVGYFAWRAIVPNNINHHDGVRVTVAPNKHVVSYPIRDRKKLNLVLIQECKNEGVFEWSLEESPDQVRRIFSDFGGDLGEAFCEIKKVNRWGLSSHNIPTIWGKDNIVLIGDALHPMLPFLAQGANFALEDAFVLAKLIDLYTMEEVTDKYVQIRKPRLLRLMKQIKKNAWNFHLKRGFFRACAHRGLVLLDKTLPQSAERPFRWLYSHDITKLNI